jgi:hypothetical protein
MNKYFYDDIFISIELGQQSALTGRATSYSNSYIWNRCTFSYSTSLSNTVTLLSLLTPTMISRHLTTVYVVRASTTALSFWLLNALNYFKT